MIVDIVTTRFVCFYFVQFNLCEIPDYRNRWCFGHVAPQLGMIYYVHENTKNITNSFLCVKI